MRIDIDGFADARLAPATLQDCAELLVLQRCCWMREAIVNETLDIPALHESLEDVRDSVASWSVWLVRQGPRLIAGVRAKLDGQAWDIGRIMVAPDLEGRGLGRWLLAYAESQAPKDARRFTLFTGAKSTRNIAMYERAGYQLTTPDAAEPRGAAVFLVKERP